MKKINIDKLEHQFDQLMRICEQLKAENTRLRREFAGFHDKRDHLKSKIITARSKMEQILNRMQNNETSL